MTTDNNVQLPPAEDQSDTQERQQFSQERQQFSQERQPYPNGAPVQYHHRSQLPTREIALSRFSPKRKSTLIALSLLTTLILIITSAISANSTLSSLEALVQKSPQRLQDRTSDITQDARTRTLGLAAAAIMALTVTVFIIVRAGPRIAALEFWIRRMGAGDLNYSVTPAGNDEITRIAYDLEALRRQSVRAQQLDLVQELSQNLQEKNGQLESVLTELHNTQDQVISRQKLAELGELTASVAHEIRNPLSLIQNFARTSGSMLEELGETLQELQAPPTPEEQELILELTTELTDNMQRMRQHSGRANRIIQDMLAMGSSAQGRHQPVMLNDLVQDHCMLAYHSARSRDPEFNVQIIREMDPETGQVSLVSQEIGRVILNLVGNACYATQQRTRSEPGHEPTITISTRRDDDAVEIRVHDNGPGIPPSIIGKIFNPFFTTKPAGQGTGLGLSLSNEIVRQHGGTITPESSPGQYCQFTVRLPASRETSRRPDDKHENKTEET